MIAATEFVYGVAAVLLPMAAVGSAFMFCLRKAKP